MSHYTELMKAAGKTVEPMNKKQKKQKKQNQQPKKDKKANG